MARANLGRSRSKTVITVISLSLAVVLMNQTVTFTNGFDMDKYLSNFVASDFIVADAAYFQTGAGFSADATVPEEIIDTVTAQGGITESGRVYGRTTPVQEFVTEDYFRQSRSLWNDEETINQMPHPGERNTDGRVQDTAQIFGMEPFALDHLKVLEGDLSGVYYYFSGDCGGLF